jgi:signal transduction histidine kinase
VRPARARDSVALVPTAGVSVPRSLAILQHVLFVGLALVGVVRVANKGAGLLPALLGTVVLLCWYAAGLALARAHGPDPGTVAGEGMPRSGRLWYLGLVACWLVLVALSPEFVWVAFPLWMLAGHFFPLPMAAALSVAILVVVLARQAIGPGTLSSAGVIGPVAGGVFAFAVSRVQYRLIRDGNERERLLGSVVRAQTEAAALHDELVASQHEAGVLEERARLSRDINDTLAQGFSSILLLSRAGADAGPERQAALLRQIQDTAAENLDEARRVVAALAPKQLDDAGLTGALRRTLGTFAEQTGITADLHVEAPLPELPTPLEVALLRVAQGALANVRQHAGAQRVVVSLGCAEDAVRLDIVDDGRGFDPGSVPRTNTGGYGLVAAQARMRELGGDLAVESRPGDGTALAAYVPLHGRPEGDGDD